MGTPKSTPDRVFTMKIELGNDSMRTHRHVAQALRVVADRLLRADTTGSIRDDNGNTVGRFSIGWADPEDV